MKTEKHCNWIPKNLKLFSSWYWLHFNDTFFIKYYWKVIKIISFCLLLEYSIKDDESFLYHHLHPFLNVFFVNVSRAKRRRSKGKFIDFFIHQQNDESDENEQNIRKIVKSIRWIYFCESVEERSFQQIFRYFFLLRSYR